MYEVINSKVIPAGRGKRALWVQLLIDARNREQATKSINAAIHDLMGDYAGVELKAYIEREAVGWGGYVARTRAIAGRTVIIEFDNDPPLRRALMDSIRRRQ